jgi:hypothetical protein
MRENASRISAALSSIASPTLIVESRESTIKVAQMTERVCSNIIKAVSKIPR